MNGTTDRILPNVIVPVLFYVNTSAMYLSSFSSIVAKINEWRDAAGLLGLRNANMTFDPAVLSSTTACPSSITMLTLHILVL